MDLELVSRAAPKGLHQPNLQQLDTSDIRRTSKKCSGPTAFPHLHQWSFPHLHQYAVKFWSPHLRRDIDKMERVQRKATKIIPEIRNHSYQQWLKDLKHISLIQRRLWGQLIDVFKYLNRFNNVSPIGLFDYGFNNRSQNNGKKLIVKRFNTSVAHHFFPINITTTWNVPPHDVVKSWTVNTFKNHLDAHWEDNPPDVLVNW